MYRIQAQNFVVNIRLNTGSRLKFFHHKRKAADMLRSCEMMETVSV